MKAAAVVLFVVVGQALGQVSVVATKHNLSVSGPGPIKAQSETQICIFCHVPHQGGTLGQNRPLSVGQYTPYNSTTLASPAPGAPSGATRICLSCHDGTIAVGQTLGSGTLSVANTTPTGTLPTGPSNLGLDLRMTHPVSFVPATTPELHPPPLLDPAKLDGQGRLQCTSCHNPHEDKLDPVQGSFLVKPNRASALCTTCHTKQFWATNPSSHQSSSSLYDATFGATTPYTTVADNGCESCHRPHGATTVSRLLKDQPSQVCMQCHNGKVAKKDLSGDLAKPSVHPVLSGDPLLHDDAEGPSNPGHSLPEVSAATQRHAQCVDCHNPHAAFSQAATAPRPSGALSGVWGIDRSGMRVFPVQNEYEVCFKCHADSANQTHAADPVPPEQVRRATPDVNLRRVFDLGAASAHPVEGPGANLTMPGLLPPYTTASQIYCSDCHASDQSPAAGGSGPAGPHGSTYPHILALNLTTFDNTPESPTSYALCYKCHDRTTLLSSQSGFSLHQTHVQQDQAPCSACHDWHGVSTLQGNPINNAHLINFDVSIVQPTTSGTLLYTAQGVRHGTCTLTCHNHVHSPSSY
jgi:predicted CXXCH cytochrome family protein